MAEINIITFNCHGIQSSREELCLLCENSDIVCIQEHWLFPEEVDQMNNVHSNFNGIGVSAIDTSKGLLTGRPFGGVGILWNKKLDSCIITMLIDYKWICGIKMKYSEGELCIFCVYESYDNLDQYVQCMAILSNLINESPSNVIYILGDFNCDIMKKSLYDQHLNMFIKECDMIASDYLFVNEMFTYVSSAWGTTSWLDHCLSTEDAHRMIKRVQVLNDYVSSDHLPLCITCNIDFMSVGEDPLSQEFTFSRPDWTKANENVLKLYSLKCHKKFENVDVSHIAGCRNMNCKDVDHHTYIKDLYVYITNCLQCVSDEVFNNDVKQSKPIIIPGWTDYVKDTHHAARDAFLIWQAAGKPRQGQVFEIMKRSRSLFKYSLRSCRRHEAQRRADSLAGKMESKNYVSFWKEVKAQSKYKSPIVNIIDEVQGSDNILNMWFDHYKNVFSQITNGVTTLQQQ